VPDVVMLDDADRDLCRRIGGLRKRSSGNAGRDFARSVVRTDDERDMDEYTGCCGELAVARRFGVTPSFDLNRFHDVPDVRCDIPGGGVDVRTAWRRPDTDCLIVRDDDPPYRAIVFATTTRDAVTVALHGWLPASAARRVGTYRDPGHRRPSWFVDRRHLRSLEDLARCEVRRGAARHGPAWLGRQGRAWSGVARQARHG
jgi:hypothetical protein